MSGEMGGLTAALKAVHILFLGVWVGGLLLFPALLAQRRGQTPGPALHRMHRRARFLYTAVLSPAAMVAIASGTALIFLREVYVPWLAAKLVLVAGLAMIHVFTARAIVEMFKEDAEPRRSVGILTFLGTAGLAAGTLVLVLGKPDLAPGLAQLEGGPGGGGLFSPGGLGARLGWLVPPLAPEGRGRPVGASRGGGASQEGGAAQGGGAAEGSPAAAPEASSPPDPPSDPPSSSSASTSPMP